MKHLLHILQTLRPSTLLGGGGGQILLRPCVCFRLTANSDTKIREKREVSQNVLSRIVHVGNDEYIVVCNFPDRIMSSF